MRMWRQKLQQQLLLLQLLHPHAWLRLLWGQEASSAEGLVLWKTKRRGGQLRMLRKGASGASQLGACGECGPRGRRHPSAATARCEYTDEGFEDEGA